MNSARFKFYYLTHALALGIVGVMGQNGGALLFFLGQGWLIQAAVAGPNKQNGGSMALLFGWVAAAKLLMMFSNIVSEHGRLYVSQKELSYQLNSRFPTRVYKDYAGRGNDILHAFIEYVPQCVDNIYQRFINNFSFALIMGMILVMGVWQQFYLGLALAVMILLFSFVHQRAFGNHLEQKVQSVQNHYRGLVQWIGEYFAGFKELSKNWGEPITSGQWLHARLQGYCRSKRSLNRAILAKDIVVQPLVEMPFLLATLVMLGSVYTRYVDFAAAFMWIGLLQQALVAAQSLGKNVELDKKQQQARSHFQQVIASITQANVGIVNTASQKMRNGKLVVRLRDGCQVNLGLRPGFYAIVGANGSGKSTLLNTITGYDRQHWYADQPAVAQLKD
jgi:ABC-type transport system involved in cytochrome bd biosynthesis fused ATPase/permease subunit